MLKEEQKNTSDKEFRLTPQHRAALRALALAAKREREEHLQSQADQSPKAETSPEESRGAA